MKYTRNISIHISTLVTTAAITNVAISDGFCTLEEGSEGGNDGGGISGGNEGGGGEGRGGDGGDDGGGGGDGGGGDS